jgi:hypothetical protein
LEILFGSAHGWRIHFGTAIAQGDAASTGIAGYKIVEVVGQNFRVDKNIVWKSVQLAQLHQDDRVVEIGPGLGTLTRALLAQQCHVFSIEFETKLYQFLSETFAPMDHFHIVQGDAMVHPFGGLSDFAQPFKIVANLPYNIATPWIDDAYVAERGCQTPVGAAEFEAIFCHFNFPVRGVCLQSNFSGGAQ